VTMHASAHKHKAARHEHPGLADGSGIKVPARAVSELTESPGILKGLRM
jgi:hypothetical protein